MTPQTTRSGSIPHFNRFVTETVNKESDDCPRFVMSSFCPARAKVTATARRHSEGGWAEPWRSSVIKATECRALRHVAPGKRREENS
ncbi:hypothetical protein NHX12_034097 [Muraenolepis orangiensis]|uniref:Uncharacterized protein n=1 Tax=Muraenolepis orangiensis TaxID=630683 RepID=A0A9Q0IH15_9TELE|nr:hypothetical protein NHX12_034097 [Muraenolepis orangiensis]